MVELSLVVELNNAIWRSLDTAVSMAPTREVPDTFSAQTKGTQVPSSFPYTSSQGSLVKAIEQFRKKFPATLDAAALQKFSIAPANESYVINTFRFLGLIDESGKQVDNATDFFLHGDDQFQSGLDGVLRKAYSALYEEVGAEPWNSSRESLSTWFRVTDKTSELIGGRQAATYSTLASLAGHGVPAKVAASTGAARQSAGGAQSAAATRKSTGPKKQPAPVIENDHGPASPIAAVSLGNSATQVGLTVRIEVNLPAGGSPEVYDAIFASIRKNLIDQ